MFKNLPIFALATALLATGVQCQQPSYKEHITALASGDVVAATASEGVVWLNITGFAPDKLPHIQDDMGVHTMDNLEPLKNIASLAQTAAKGGQYGDIVFLYSAFAMNAHYEYLNVSSPEMQEALLNAVVDQSTSQVDSSLADLYSSTSSTKELADAFKSLKSVKLDPRGKRWTKEVCSNAHKAAKSACQSLLSNVRFNATVKSGGPRNICKFGCCISWSANATFQIQNLTSAANYCINACGSSTVSCEVFGVELQGTIVDQCLSNRADGCK
ncbi:hypothetical protein AAP_02019 [Ascosphaera apis ARSEF 7405]|uniref:WD-like domain-containing protein n=1 Tax=Ascosphaera apis ARSEF 7405 TaxID=392613 RepID=A0A168AHA0_9EURO|nr:hypothetical protein AAP_02019 [Ascosphaera apis ARSEF 7405]